MRRAMVIGTVLLVLSAAACGSDSKEKSSDAPAKIDGKVNDHGTKALSGESIEIELDDFYFGPTYVTASAGKTVEVELHNEGTTAHTFTIDSLSVDMEVAPDATETVQVTLPDSGSAVYHCRFHDDQGMQGAFAID